MLSHLLRLMEYNFVVDFYGIVFFIFYFKDLLFFFYQVFIHLSSIVIRYMYFTCG